MSSGMHESAGAGGTTSLGWMARDQTTHSSTSRLYVPLIIGLILGVTVAAATDQWWWSTVGVLAGAAVGGIAELIHRRSRR